MVICTELRAGRITQQNDRFALNAERWTPEQVDALRALAFEPSTSARTGAAGAGAVPAATAALVSALPARTRPRRDRVGAHASFGVVGSTRAEAGAEAPWARSLAR